MGVSNVTNYKYHQESNFDTKFQTEYNILQQLVSQFPNLICQFIHKPQLVCNIRWTKYFYQTKKSFTLFQLLV